MIFVQHAHHFLGLGGFGESREATQIENTTVSSQPVRLQRIVGAAADDQFGQLR